jgi:hypothetical protein
MDEHPIQCEFFVPIILNSDKEPRQPTAWNLLGNEIRRAYPAEHSGPEESISTATVRQLINEQLTPLREQMT